MLYHMPIRQGKNIRHVNTYSYTAMMNSTPEDYVAAFEAIDVPLLIIVGSNDETMQADAFPNMMDEVAPDGELHIIVGENHGSIRYSMAFIETVQNWLLSTSNIN